MPEEARVSIDRATLEESIFSLDSFLYWHISKRVLSLATGHRGIRNLASAHDGDAGRRHHPHPIAVSFARSSE